ncbi:ankyrin repeat domain-containing protein [Actinomadura sp. 1N219]|uniref:ankyrin repeat domain-containing protein n=1 Tax=Actinomadura sp. 1N219 TaxID=3375152 RepID=UPI00378F93C4
MNGLGGGRGAAAAVLLVGLAVATACGSGPPPKASGSPSGSASAPAAPAGTSRAGKDLLDAAGRGDATAVKAALAAGAVPSVRDGQGRTPLLLAARGDHVEAAKVLVKAGADPDAQDDTKDSAWLVTGVTGSVEMARILIPAKPDYTVVNRFGGTSLIPAAERGHAAYVREVLRTTSVKVDHVNDLGWTALLEAVILGDGGADHQRVVALLLEAGADPALADREGVTPLRHAERKGQTEIANLLRDA